jgi:hypothetical protein
MEFITDAQEFGSRLHGISWLRGELTWLAVNFDREAHHADSIMVVLENHGRGDLRGAIMRSSSASPDGSVLIHLPRVISRFRFAIAAPSASADDSPRASL